MGATFMALTAPLIILSAVVMGIRVYKRRQIDREIYDRTVQVIGAGPLAFRF